MMLLGGGEVALGVLAVSLATASFGVACAWWPGTAPPPKPSAAEASPTGQRPPLASSQLTSWEWLLEPQGCCLCRERASADGAAVLMPESAR